MRILIISCLLFFFQILSFNVSSQDIHIDGVFLNDYLLEETDLFNGVLISNTTPETQKVLITGLIKDRNQRTLLKVTANAEVLSEQSNLVNFNNLIVNDYSGYLLAYIKETGKIPQAQLTFCVKLVHNGNETDHQCFTQSSFINTDLNLQYPYDLSEINSLRPSLFWSFSGHTDAISYHLVLKHKNRESSNTEAFNFGQTIINVTGIKDEILDFPVEISDLIEGETYLWQVEVFLNNLSLGKTDIWEFKVGTPLDISKLPISKSYVDIDEIIGEPTLYVLGEIKLKVKESKKKGKLQLRIVKIPKKKKSGKTIGKKELEIELGENYYVIDLTTEYHLIHNKKYTLVLKNTNTKKESRIHFIYLNPDYIK